MAAHPVPDGPAFTCPDCRQASHNLWDIINAYCDNCHQFKPEDSVDPATWTAAKEALRNLGAGVTRLDLVDLVRRARKDTP